YPRRASPWVFGIFYALIPQEWTQQDAWQYADRPLAALLLAAVGCTALAIRQRRANWDVLAGLFWGASGFCKDEGKAALVVLAVGTFLATVCSLSYGGGWRAIRNLALLMLGLLPGVGSLALQWHQSPVATKLIAHMTVEPLRDTERTVIVLDFLRHR